MWDPSETLGRWVRDDDVLSWRSLDTLRGMETNIQELDPLRDDADGSISDASDMDELVEVIERQPVNNFSSNIPRVSGTFSKARETTAYHHGNNNIQRGTNATPSEYSRLKSASEDGLQSELPSTSEMVRIPEERVSPEWKERAAPANGRAFHPSAAAYPIPTHTNETPSSLADQMSWNAWDSGQHIRPDQPRHVTVGEKRSSMTLADLLPKNGTANNELAVHPLTHAPSMTTENGNRTQEKRELERRCEELAEKERHLQIVLARQLHQIETLTEQLQQKDAKFQVQQLDISGLKEKTSMQERQVAALQQSLRDKENALEQSTQLLVQRANDVASMENKVRSLQAANESFQEQARKATEEKDKVHKDYLQVVFELGKLQKQLNASAKETVSIAEKDLLLREIDQLKFEKEKLAAKIKEVEARKALSAQSNSVADAQRIKELVAKVRDLEDELTRVRGARPPIQANQPTPSSRYPPQETYPSSLSSYPPPAPPAEANRLSTNGYYQPAVQSSVPSLLQGLQHTPHYDYRTDRSMTLKDMVNETRQYPPPARQPTPPPTASSGMSLASLGFTVANRRASGPLPVDYGGYDPTGGYTPSLGSTTAVNPALTAPFATEKQTLLQDSLQRREMEQKLLKLHVEKEQTEAKLIKVEQSGLKTMSSRNEKSWLESHLRDLTVEISRLKLTLR